MLHLVFTFATANTALSFPVGGLLFVSVLVWGQCVSTQQDTPTLLIKILKKMEKNEIKKAFAEYCKNIRAYSKRELEIVPIGCANPLSREVKYTDFFLSISIKHPDEEDRAIAMSEEELKELIEALMVKKEELSKLNRFVSQLNS